MFAVQANPSQPPPKPPCPERPVYFANVTGRGMVGGLNSLNLEIISRNGQSFNPQLTHTLVVGPNEGKTNRIKVMCHFKEHELKLQGLSYVGDDLRDEATLSKKAAEQYRPRRAPITRGK